MKNPQRRTTRDDDSRSIRMSPIVCTFFQSCSLLDLQPNTMSLRLSDAQLVLDRKVAGSINPFAQFFTGLKMRDVLA